MNKKKTLSILLAVVIAFTALAVFSNTVSADQTDPQEPVGTGITDPLPTDDEPSVPDARFELIYQVNSATGNGPTSIPCELNPLVFGKVTGGKIAKRLDLVFNRKGEIVNNNGEHVAEFNVTKNGNIGTTFKPFVFIFTDQDNSGSYKFTVTAVISTSVYNSLAAGNYTAKIYYSSLWRESYITDDTSTVNATPGPDGVISMPLKINGSIDDPVPVPGPNRFASYKLLPGSYTITHGGVTNIECSFESLVLGDVQAENGSLSTAQSLVFNFKHGTLKDDSNHSIAFAFGTSSLSFLNKDYNPTIEGFRSSDEKFTLPLYIEPADFYALPAGTYKGQIEYESFWITGNSTGTGFETRSISLTLVIPDTETYIVDSGKCGATSSDDLTWTLYSDSRLEITGNGEMKDYAENTDPSPWRVYRDQITRVKIGNGVTKIGSHAFYYLDEIVSAEFSSSITTIGSSAFAYCAKLSGIVIPDSLSEIGSSAFLGCANLKSIVIPSQVKEIRANAFMACNNLSDIYCYASPDTLTWNSANGGGFKSDKSTKCHVIDRLSEYEENFSDINVTFVLTEQINIGGNAHLYGYTLSLAGDIGVNFWMKLDDACKADDNYMLFTVNGKTQKVKVSEASTASNSAYKVFRCGVTAKEMTDTITARFYLADGTAVGSAYTYTIREYANYILTHDNYSSKAKDVVKAMLNYGACSQKYFNYHINSLANSVLPENECLTQISSPDSINIKAPGEGCITPAKVSLVLNSTVTLKLYFNRQDAGHKIFERNGVPLATSTSGDYTVVVIDNISAADIHSAVVIDVIENNARLGSVMYSPAKYIKIVLGLPTDNVITDDLKLAVSSLYYFNQALQKYIQSGAN